MRVRLAAFVAATLVASVSAVASAEPMDPALERLVGVRDADGFKPRPGVGADTCHPGGVWANDATGKTVSTACVADDGAFKRLISQYAFAFAPTAMHSARTTGYGGFHLSLESDFTSISSDKD